MYNNIHTHNINKLYFEVGAMQKRQDHMALEFYNNWHNDCSV